MIADPLTKGLPPKVFKEHVARAEVVRPHQQKNVGIVIHDEQSINVICSNEDERRQELVQAKHMSSKGKEKATYAMGNKNERGKIIGEEGWISLGPWGREGGVYSTYKSDGPIMQITVSCGDVIDYILFESKSRNGVVIGSSVKIGGHGGANGAKFCIDSSVEHLSAISLTYGDYCGYMDKIIGEEGWISLGPWGGGHGVYSTYKPDKPIMHITIRYGEVIDSILFESKSRDGVVIGSSVKIGGPGGASVAKGKIKGEEGWISFGPWGGNDGVDWTYKANGPIMQIRICYGEAINSVLFQSRSSDGFIIGSSEEFGATGSHTTKTFFIDSSVEQLSLLRLTYGDYYGQVAITSLYFETNIGKHYGPFGLESGASSVSIPIEGGFIAGFHGRCGIGTYLTAIDLYPDICATQMFIRVLFESGGSTLNIGGL
ncbi:hypothetical protein RHSIM_Rhsim12G0045300 [Rhododendron simsii]|uniref:Jacalin-type lectin domain-containing protein n=1 Tax=Rhododendron simsii TaxID=118357 RepID=A0A834G2Z4_RHOSS|nr:hypothetical protein RHSIM_Rhsim12G0045300 [Rhododendron simsii]